MRTRVGIELTPSVCRMVEVANPHFMGRRRSRDSVVRSFAVCQPSGPDAHSLFASLRGKPATVVVWGTANEHCQVEVRPGSYEAMRAEALRTLDGAGVPTRRAWADIAPAGTARGARRPVVLAMAESEAMTVAVRPLMEAGIRVRSAITPAAALAAIARSRRSFSSPDVVDAYVALEETCTSFALLRKGALIGARDVPWGFLDGEGGGGELRDREEIVVRLAEDLVDFFATHEEEAGRVSQVCICGGLPELRSTTLPLMERLELEVETLDSLSGIDGHDLPERADEFRNRASELRLAWAAAADWSTINLMRPRRRRMAHVALSRAAVAAGVVVGFAGSWVIAQSDVWDQPDPSQPGQIVASASPSPSAPGAEPPVQQLLPPSMQAPQEPSAILREILPEAHEAAPVVRDLAPISTPVPVPPPIRREPPPVVPDPIPTVTEPQATLPVRPRAPRTPPPPIRQEPPLVRRVATESRIAKPAPVEETIPLEAQIGGILFSADRQLAIVDGRVVGRGDEVRGATVVDITASAILVRDSQGRLRRLTSSTRAQ